MADLSDLQTIESQLITRIKEVTAQPKPSYNIDGQSVSWNQYMESLWKQLKQVQDQINGADPFEEVGQGAF